MSLGLVSSTRTRVTNLYNLARGSNSKIKSPKSRESDLLQGFCLKMEGGGGGIQSGRRGGLRCVGLRIEWS